MSRIILEPENFQQKVKKQITIAQQTGALQSIPTDYEIFPSGGIDFVLRIINNLVRKEEAKKQEALNPDFDPFLPYEPDLFVADISDTHLCLLNKYNVVDEHLLIVTREFEEQDKLLNLEDFIALWAILVQLDGLAFYNSGKIAGASVRHKHLQLVPQELAPGIPHIPIEKIMDQIEWQESIGTITAFPFTHVYTKLEYLESKTVTELAEISLQSYQKLLKALNIQAGTPYNLLMRRQWMLIVPRSQASYQDIGINSLGFAGAMLVCNWEQLNLVKEYQPLNILKAVAITR